MDKVIYLDEDGQQHERDCTPEEQAEIDAMRAQAPAVERELHNAPIIAALEQIDAKSIRALREGNTERIAALEAQAAALRLQLLKEPDA